MPVLLALVGLSPAAEEAPKRRSPNIVLILVDDLGAECLSSYGDTSYQTPHLDALARSGLRFENACGTPRSSPSRVELLSGRYGFRTGWTHPFGKGAPRFLDPQHATLGRVFRDAGYATALAGKWQLSDFGERADHVKECGFEEYCAWTGVLRGRVTRRHWNPSIWQRGKLQKGFKGRYGEDVFSDFLVDFMRRNRSKPFLAYYPMVLVHPPFVATPEEPGKYGERRGSSQKDFSAMVAHMDKTVGRIVSALEEMDLLRDTLIILTADNGTPRAVTSKVGAIDIRGGKGTMTHVGTRVPLIVSWKGVIQPGRVSSNLVDLSDILPTLADVAGIALPRDLRLDGRSFVPELRGEPGKPREWVFSQLGDARFARDARWILHGDGRLHDLQSDPLETKEVPTGSSPEADAARKRLQAALDEIR